MIALGVQSHSQLWKQGESTSARYKVLVETGANEVVRPHHPQWRHEIMQECSKGKPVSMKLAGGKIITGAMTQYGEVMPPPPNHGDGVGWMLPVQRAVRELGMEMIWTQDYICLRYPGGKGDSFDIGTRVTFHVV